jgi:hypothetical protein
LALETTWKELEAPFNAWWKPQFGWGGGREHGTPRNMQATYNLKTSHDPVFARSYAGNWSSMVLERWHRRYCEDIILRL